MCFVLVKLNRYRSQCMFMARCLRSHTPKRGPIGRMVRFLTHLLTSLILMWPHQVREPDVINTLVNAGCTPSAMSLYSCYSNFSALIRTLQLQAKQSFKAGCNVHTKSEHEIDIKCSTGSKCHKQLQALTYCTPLNA